LAGRENLSDAELDTVAKTAMEIFYREAYYETHPEETVVEKKRTGIPFSKYMTKIPRASFIQPIESH
jgi:hypothetical protein